MWRHVGLVRKDVSEERVASIFKLENIRERRKELAVGKEAVVLQTYTVSWIILLNLCI
jgi:hypothetical protein